MNDFKGDPPRSGALDPQVEQWKAKFPPCTRLEIAEVLARFEDPEDIETELRRRTARYLSPG